jgi:hypothetical protein
MALPLKLVFDLNISTDRSRDAVLDKENEDRGAMEDPELIDHLASMRVALLRREKKAA